MSKRADELIAWTYAHLHKTPMTGLRFFTVYGPWGRPDMAAYLFTDKITRGKPITVFNNGDMRRDFTYIDDIVSGILASLAKPPAPGDNQPPYALYNLGNSKAENLMDFISVIEKTLGKKAIINFQPIPPGDVPITFADITESTRDLNYRPTTSIDVGIPRFIEWYRGYTGGN